MKKTVFSLVCASIFCTSSFAIVDIVREMVIGAILFGKYPTPDFGSSGGQNQEAEKDKLLWLKVKNEIRQNTKITPEERLYIYKRLAGKGKKQQLNLIWQCNEKDKEEQCRTATHEYLIDKKYISCMDPSFFESSIDSDEKITKKAQKCVPEAIAYADGEIKEYEEAIKARYEDQK